MRIRLAAALVLCTTALSYAQPPIAQYRKELAGAQADSQKFNIYKDAFDEYKNGDNDSLRYLVEEGLAAFDKSGYKKGKAGLLVMQSGIYTELGLMTAAERSAEEALALYTELKDETGIARTQMSVGLVAGQKGNYDKAVGYFLKGLRHFEHIKDTPGIVGAYVKLGVANDYTGNYEKALSYYDKALPLALAINQTGNIIFLYNNKGTTYGRLRQYEKALEYFDSALNVTDEPKYARALVSPLMNKGNAYNQMYQPKKALEYYYKALKIAEDLQIREEYAQVLYNIGVVEIEEKDPNDISKFNEALSIARELGDRRLEIDILEGLGKWAENVGKYKEQVQYMRQEQALKDSLLSAEKAAEIASLEAEYELEKTNNELQEIKEAEQSQRVSKNLIIVVAALLMAMLIAVIVLLQRARKLNKELEERQKQLEEANRVKDRLFSIIGHDLKAPIGSIPVLLEIYRSVDTDEGERQFIMDSLEEHAKASIETLDKLLNWGKLQIKGNGILQTVCDAGEIAENKIRLFKVTAANKNISLANHVPADLLVTADENQLKFVLRNLLSNAIKFTSSGGLIEMDAVKDYEPGMVMFSVKDNGMGIPKEKIPHIFEPYNTSTSGTANESGTSIGLMLCREFVQQNGGRIWVESELGKGTTFYFTVKTA